MPGAPRTPGGVWRPLLIAGLVAIAPFDLNLPGNGWTGLYLRPLMLASAVVALLVIAEERRHLDRRLALAVAGLVTAYGVTATLSNDPMLGYSITVRIAVLGLLFLAATVAFRQESDVAHLQIGAAIGVCLAAAIGLIILANGSDAWGTSLLVGSVSESRGVSRLTRPFSHANVAAMYLAPAGVLLASAALAARSSRAATLFGAAALFATLAVSLTMSRAGLAAMSLGAVVVPLTSRSAGWEPTNARILSGRTVLNLPIAMVAILVVPPLVWNRWDERLAPIQSAAPKSLGRPEIWHQALDAFLSQPTFGVGPGGFGAYSKEATADGYAAAAHAHNPALEILATGGLVVTLTAVALVYAVYRVVSKPGESKSCESGSGVPVRVAPWPAVAVTLVPMAVDNPFPFSSSANLVVLLAGATVGVLSGSVSR